MRLEAVRESYPTGGSHDRIYAYLIYARGGTPHLREIPISSDKVVSGGADHRARAVAEYLAHRGLEALRIERLRIIIVACRISFVQDAGAIEKLNAKRHRQAILTECRLEIIGKGNPAGLEHDRSRSG